MKTQPIERSLEEDIAIEKLLHEAGSLQHDTRGVASRKLIEMRERLHPRELKSLIGDAWWLHDDEFSLLKETLKAKDPSWVDTNPGNN